MKFLETHFNEYIQSSKNVNLHPSLHSTFNKFPKKICDLKNIIFYGPPGVGKYTQMLNSIQQYSPSELKYEKKLTCTYNKYDYIFKISDIHFEIDMSLLGCHSKLLWNDIFITINDVLSECSGETIRYVLMQAHYRAPLNFSKKSLVEAKKSLSRLYRAVDGYQVNNETDHETISNLYDDLNTPKALARAHYLADQANKGSKECAQLLKNFSKMLGILSYSSEDWFKSRNNSQNTKKLNNKISEKEINKLILERQNAKQERNFKKADEIREKLLNLEIILEDQPGKTTWRKV